ncbi:MAG: hypothetical protein C4308_11090 [Chitinophagaceae bacterium]
MRVILMALCLAMFSFSHAQNSSIYFKGNLSYDFDFTSKTGTVKVSKIKMTVMAAPAVRFT